MIRFLRYKRISLAVFLILIVGSAGLVASKGLEFGIEFTGGTIFELEFQEERPQIPLVREKLAELGYSGQVQTTDEAGMIFRMRDLSAQERLEVLEGIESLAEFEEMRLESIGPVIGAELRNKTALIAALALASIVVYIAFAFSRVREPLSSWYYGGSSLIAVAHDVLVPLGVFSVLGALYGVEVTIPVVVALLTVVGYSINNTVVVFDRIRENTALREKESDFSFTEVVNESLNQTLSRQVNTALSTLLVLLAIFFFGGETMRFFSLALIVGIVAGTYSSIFAVPSLLAFFAERKSVDNNSKT